VSEQIRKKFDDKAKPMILIGYHPIGAYKLYDPRRRKDVINRDVLIDETKGWNWEINVAENGERKVIVNLEDKQSEDDVPSGGEQLTRSQRGRQVPQTLREYELYSDTTIIAKRDFVHFALLAESEPMSHDEASQSSHWRTTMEEELRSIEKNQIWELVNLPQLKRPIDVKWVYKTKVKPNGDVSKYKTRLVVRDFCRNMAWTTMKFSL